MRIIGTGSALPKKIVTNDMLSEFLDTGDEWIVPRTGIRKRHVISDENIEDLGAEAAMNAIKMSGLDISEIDYFICSNVINEYITPGLSCIISEKIGLSCPCIDINCACPGFIYAMDIAESHFQAGRVKNVLIVCAEEPTRMTDWHDRSTCVLFGDGAAAAVFTAGNNMKGIRLHSQPSTDKIWQKRKLEPTPYITKDETTVPVINKEKHRADKEYLWMVRSVMERLVIFHYDKGSRAGSVIESLANQYHFKGYLQCDGFAGYETAFKTNPDVRLVNCLAHIRRHFGQALDESRELAEHGLTQIQLVYKIFPGCVNQIPELFLHTVD